MPVLAISPADMPMSASTCCPAPSDGVLVTAPDMMPSTAASGTWKTRWIAAAVAAPITTSAAAMRLSFSPDFFSAEKKPGPTWMPIV